MRNRQTRKIVEKALLAIAMITAVSSIPAFPQRPASLDQLLNDISGYNGEVDSAAFWKLRDYLYARKDDGAARAECEVKLLAFLGTNATPVAKMAVCRHLRLIGSEKSVAVLASMLLDQNAIDPALYALQRIQGVAVDKALIQALGKTEGASRIAIIAALGERGSVEAIPGLSSLLQTPGETAIAAATALGAIGGDAAANALSGAMAGAAPALKPALAGSLLKCAEKMIAAKKAAQASAIYEKLLGDKTVSAAAREAAMIGKISVSGPAAQAIVLEQLKSQDARTQNAAVSKVNSVFRPESIEPLCKMFPSFSPGVQVKLLSVFSGYPREKVVKTVTDAAHSSSPEVKIAALRALQSVGDAGSVAFLAETAADSRGTVQAVARETLALMKGQSVDDAILAQLGKKPWGDVEAELVTAAANRRIYTAKGLIVSGISAESARIRTQSLRALRIVGTPSDMPAVVDLLLKTGDDAERADGEATLTALALKIANSDGRANMIKERLAEVKDPAAQAKLFPVLGRIGDDSSLPVLRAAMGSRDAVLTDAAVRAVAAWPSPAARDDVAEIARRSSDETHRLLAIQGMVRIAGLERFRKPEAVVADLRTASLFATRPEERRLILGILPRFSCPEALDLAGTFLADPSVKAEAQAAIDKIRPRVVER